MCRDEYGELIGWTHVNQLPSRLATDLNDWETSATEGTSSDQADFLGAVRSGTKRMHCDETACRDVCAGHGSSRGEFGEALIQSFCFADAPEDGTTNAANSTGSATATCDSASSMRSRSPASNWGCALCTDRTTSECPPSRADLRSISNVTVVGMPPAADTRRLIASRGNGGNPPGWSRALSRIAVSAKRE